MFVEIFFVIIGLAFILWLWGFTYQLLRSRRYEPQVEEKPILPVNLLDNNDGVIVAEGRGHLVYINQNARNLFGLNGGDPNLTSLSSRVEPSDVFQDLFADEGRASFRLGMKRVQAASHAIPTTEGRRMVVVLRDASREASEDEDLLDPERALMVVQEVSQTIAGGLDLRQTLNTILTSISRVLQFDAGEITLWDNNLNALRPVGRIGDRVYANLLDEIGGLYEIDEGFTGWIARYRQPLMLGDVSVRSDVRPKLESFPFKSYAGLPLLISNRFIGTLELVSYQRHAFDHEDLALLQSVAGQAAIAIENARLSGEQASRLTQLSGLQDIVQTMGETSSSRQLFEQLNARIAELMNVDVCGILLFESDSESLVSQLPFYGVPDSVISLYRIPAPPNSAGYNIWQNSPWWFSNDLLNNELVGALNMRNMAEVIGLRSAALVPLSIGNNRIGLVQVSNKRDGGGFNEDDMRLLSIFAAQATIVIENANLYERERRYVAELAGLQQMTQVMNTADQSELLKEVTQRIAGMMRAEMCGLLFFENNTVQGDEQEHILVAQKPFYGIDEDGIQFYQVPVALGSVFDQLYAGRDFWFTNDLKMEVWAGAMNFAQLASMLGFQRTLMVPLIIGEQRIGLLQVSNKLSGEDFTDSDARLMMIAAGQAAVLIENVRLFREVERLTLETDTMRTISEAAATQTDVSKILEVAMGRIARLFGVQVVAVGFLDTQTGDLNYEPTAIYGTKLAAPIVMDAYSAGFANSPVISRRPFRTEDMVRDKRVLTPYRQIASRMSLKNCLIVPLVINQRSLGEIIIANRLAGEFTEADEQLLLTIGAQIAAAVERGRLNATSDADLRTRLEEQESIERLNRELSETLILDRLLDVIRNEVLRSTPAQEVSVVLFKPSSEWVTADRPEVESRMGLTQLFTGESVGVDDDPILPIERQVLQTGDAVTIDDFATASIAAGVASARSAIAQPVRLGNEVAGIISVFSNQPAGLPDQTRVLLSRLSRPASLAVRNARQYSEQLQLNERLTRRAVQLQHISYLGQLLREGADLAQLMQEVARAISATIGFRVVAMNVVDNKVQSYRMIAVVGAEIGKEEQDKTVVPVEYIAGMMQPRWKIGDSYFLPAELKSEWMPDQKNLSVRTDPEFAKKTGPRGWRTQDELLVPIRGSSGNMLGFISVDDPRDGLRPDAEEVESLEVFAAQVGSIIENFRLVESVQQEAESARRERDRLAQLHLVSSEIQRASDMSARLQAVADGIVSAGWQRVQITLRDEKLEPSLLIYSGYEPEEAGNLYGKLLPGKIWRERFNDLAFHDLRVGRAYYLRYNHPWVQKNIFRGRPPTPREVAEDDWHPQDVLYLPLYGQDQKRIIGLIRMGMPTDGQRPTEDSLQPIELFALQASAAIENTRLYQETARQAETEQRLNELMEAMASTLDQTEIVRALAGGLKPFVVFTRMHLALPMGDNSANFEMTRVELTPDGRVHIFPDNPIPTSNTALGIVFATGRSQTFETGLGSSFEAYEDLPIWAAEGERMMLMVPMIAGGKTLGVLRLGSELGGTFGLTDSDSMTLVQRMANLSAVSIQNSRLFGSLEESTSFNEAVVQSIQQGIIVLDAELRIQLANAFMISHYGWSPDVVGRQLFDYRPEFRDFLEDPLREALITGREYHQFDLQDIDSDGRLVIRNFYTYPLRQRDRITGIVLLVEDITQRAVLEANLATQAEQLSTLTTVSSQMTGTLKPDEVVEVVLDALDNVIPYDGAVVWLLDPKYPDRLQIAAARGFYDPGTASSRELIGLWVEIDSSELFRDMSANRKVINAGDTTSGDPRFPYGEARVYKNWLGVPLISKSEIIGVLQLEKKQANFYTGQHEQLLQTFANQSAVALSNAQLFAETQDRAEELNRQAERLALLNRVSVSLSQSLDIENVFEITLRETAIALNVPEAAAIKVDQETGICKVLIEHPRGDEEPSMVFSMGDNALMQRIREALLPQVIENIQSDTPLTRAAREMMRRKGDVQTTLIVPLVISGSIIGAMRFDILEPNTRFTSEQIDLAQTLASQAAIAVQNAGLYEQSVQRTYQLETLFEAAQSTAVTLDLEDAMRRVVTQMLIALRADTCSVMTWDNIENTLILSESASTWVEEVPHDPKGTLYDLAKYPLRMSVLSDRRVISIRADDPNADEGEVASMNSAGVSARVLVPLIVNEMSIGVAQLDLREKGRYVEPSQIRLLRTLASQAAIAIENARLQTETRSQIEELYLINDLSMAVSSTVDFDQILDKIRDQLPMLTDAQFVYVALYDREKNEIHFPVAIDQLGDDVPLTNYAPSPKDEFGYIIQRRAPLLMAGLSLSQIRANLGMTETLFPTAMCFLGVPMFAGDELTGILAVRDDENARKFSLNDQRILNTVGAQLAVALQNARLFKQMAVFTETLERRVLERTSQLEQERQRLSTLYNITSEIAAATLDLDRILHSTLEAVSEAIGATSAVVLAIDDISDRLYVLTHRGLDVGDESERLQLRQNEGLAGWVIQNRQGLVLPDVQKDPRWLSITARDRQPRACVAALLESAEDIRGVIMFFNEATGVFNDEHLRLVVAAATQLANAMNNSELYVLIRDQAERLGAILRQEQVESTKNTATLNSIADGVLYANERGIIRVFNNTAERILGLSSDQVLNRHIRELTGIYGGRATGWADTLENWMQNPTHHLDKAEQFVEELLTLEDGRVVSVRLTPVNMGDQFLGTVSVFRDITREVEVDRLKSEFVATVSHELRTPMTSIKGYADLLLLGAAGEITEAQQRFLQTIKQNADRLSILVNDLLEVSRIDQGRMPLRFAPVDVNEVLQTVRTHLEGRIKDQDKAMTVELDVPNDLPRVRADYDKIIQVIQNIADNAFNYTPEEGTIHLSAQYVPDDEAVIFVVRDSGIGIPPEVQSRVFERFFRGDEYSEVVMDTPGTGLGLAIVKELVGMHEGTIWLESAVGKGTTFYVKIPVAVDTLETEDNQN